VVANWTTIPTTWLGFCFAAAGDFHGPVSASYHDGRHGTRPGSPAMAFTLDMKDTVPDDQPSLDALEAAAVLIYQSMPPTPQYRWPLLEARVGTTVWVKHENHTPTGAFKVRGGLVYLDELCRSGASPEGVISATRGNHGQSVGFAARQYGIPAAVVVPFGNSVEKNAAMRSLGVEVIEQGHDFQAAAEAADEIAIDRGWHRFPSFHPLLVRGVGTYAVELFRAVPELDTVYVPVGMGSGLCGVIAARDGLGLGTRVVAVVSERAPAFALSYEQGRIVSHDATTRIADGMACRTPVEAALAIARRGAERVVRVSDDEVESAMRALFTDTHNTAEGGGAAALAALVQEKERMRGRKVAVVLSGGNVDSNLFASVLKAAD
jgi:threonine dehydratase